MYVNGNQITAFGTATYPSQNQALGFTNNTSTLIGSNQGVGNLFDGYMADINFIDGQALEPYYFGNNDANGVWKPKAYTGTYGTNGFYLKFSDIATTSGSNAGLGKDFSGNTNYWTTNNISVTSGTTYDAMKDSPTNTSATVANYAVLNPVYKSASQPTISNGNLTVAPSAVNYQNAFSTIGVTSGKWYAEVVVTGTPNSANMIGVANAAQLNYLTGTANVIGTTTGVGYGYYIYNGNKYSAGTSTAYGNSIASGDIVGIALDLDNGKIWFSKNGTWQASGDPAAGTNAAFTGIASDTWSIGSTVYSGGVTSFNHNFGQRPFTYTPPTGFVALNTYNLPTPTILQGNTVMDATLWTGTGSGITITNAGGFKPDLVWYKQRNGTRNHLLFDSVRGTTKYLQSNTTNAEQTDAQSLTSFNSNGFTLGTNGNGATNGETYVGWQWQAGQGSTSSNTLGNITSTVSVNATAGFSVVGWTSDGSASIKTMGHGLGVAPVMIIVRRRDSTGGTWYVYHKSLSIPNDRFIKLNSTDGEQNPGNTIWSTSSTTFGFYQSNIAVNGNTCIGYAWAEIAGFSRFGSYTGNGSTDGPFVFTGFRPKFVMIKRTDSTENWQIVDSSRDIYNVAINTLFPNLINAESGGVQYDLLSNGFKVKSSTGGGNTSGGTYIYMVFAEAPFKNSLAR